MVKLEPLYSITEVYTRMPIFITDYIYAPTSCKHDEQGHSNEIHCFSSPQCRLEQTAMAQTLTFHEAPLEACGQVLRNNESSGLIEITRLQL